jgi:hypothetical protein
MTDLLLRGLARRWRAEADPHDEVALLQAAVRCGRLTAKQADLLAWVGHPAAILVRGEPAAPANVTAWVLGLAPWGKLVCDRAAIACAFLAQARLQRVGAAGVLVRDLALTLQRWVDHPCPACRDRVASAHADYRQAFRTNPWSTNGRLADVVSRAALAVAAGRLRKRVACAAGAAGQLAQVVDVAAVRAAIKEAIVAAVWTDRRASIDG